MLLATRTSDLIFFNSGALPNILHYITLQVTQRPHLNPTRFTYPAGMEG